MSNEIMTATEIIQRDEAERCDNEKPSVLLTQLCDRMQNILEKHGVDVGEDDE